MTFRVCRCNKSSDDRKKAQHEAEPGGEGGSGWIASLAQPAHDDTTLDIKTRLQDHQMPMVERRYTASQHSLLVDLVTGHQELGTAGAPGATHIEAWCTRTISTGRCSHAI